MSKRVPGEPVIIAAGQHAGVAVVGTESSDRGNPGAPQYGGESVMAAAFASIRLLSCAAGSAGLASGGRARSGFEDESSLSIL